MKNIIKMNINIFSKNKEKEADAKGNYYWNKESKEDVDDKRVQYLKWLSTKSLSNKIEYKKK